MAGLDLISQLNGSLSYFFCLPSLDTNLYCNRLQAV